MLCHAFGLQTTTPCGPAGCLSLQRAHAVMMRPALKRSQLSASENEASPPLRVRSSRPLGAALHAARAKRCAAAPAGAALPPVGGDAGVERWLAPCTRAAAAAPLPLPRAAAACCYCRCERGQVSRSSARASVLPHNATACATPADARASQRARAGLSVGGVCVIARQLLHHREPRDGSGA